MNTIKQHTNTISKTRFLKTWISVIVLYFSLTSSGLSQINASGFYVSPNTKITGINAINFSNSKLKQDKIHVASNTLFYNLNGISNAKIVIAGYGAIGPKITKTKPRLKAVLQGAIKNNYTISFPFRNTPFGAKYHTLRAALVIASSYSPKKALKILKRSALSYPTHHTHTPLVLKTQMAYALGVATDASSVFILMQHFGRPPPQVSC